MTELLQREDLSIAGGELAIFIRRQKTELFDEMTSGQKGRHAYCEITLEFAPDDLIENLVLDGIIGTNLRFEAGFQPPYNQRASLKSLC